MKKIKIWHIPLGLLALIIIVGVSFSLTHSGLGANTANPPKFIQAEFIDLSKVYSVSKFRSGAGHDFSGGGETCRSMKHYFTPQIDEYAQNYRSYHNGQFPTTDSSNDIPIYSPVDGTIARITGERSENGNQIHIVPDHAKQYDIRIFHVHMVPGLKAGLLGLGGTHVKAGQLIGHIGQYQGTDIAVQVGIMPWNNKYISYFEVMPDSVFESYKARGATSRDDFIFTKEYRDAHPFQCAHDQGENFTHAQDRNYDTAKDEFHLTGYVDPRSFQQRGGGPGGQQNGSGQ